MTDDNMNNSADNANLDKHDKTIHRYACPICSTYIPITQKICPQCEVNLTSGIETDKLLEEPAATASSQPSPQPRQERYTLGSSYFSAEMTLRIE